MFENLQDTSLLHSTILSIMDQMNPPQESEPNRPSVSEDSHDAVNMVPPSDTADMMPPSDTADMVPPSDTASETLKEPKKELFEMEGANMVTSFITALVEKRLKRPLTFAKLIEEELYVNRRCHATMFYTVLKSNGITCPQATSYFESIDFFPSTSWRFYIMLCFHCEWSEYFIESAIQLESDVLAIIVKIILEVEFPEEQLKYYSWHMILQVIIWKFFIIEDPTLCSFQDCIPFSHPFAVANSVPEIEKQETHSQDPLFYTYKVFLNHLLSFSVSSVDNFYYNKVILHAYKTIFKLVRKLKTFEKNIVIELFLLSNLFEQCNFKKESEDDIKSYTLKEAIYQLHYHSNASWKITQDYLLFILCSYWNDALKILSDGVKVPFVSLAEHFPLNEVKDKLISICSFYADDLEEKDYSFLSKVLVYSFPCATNAAVVILHHPKVREEEEFLQILESRASVLKPLIIYKELIDVIVQTESKETRIRFLKLLHLILSRATSYLVSIYNDALKYIYLKHDMEDHFKLDNFDNELAAFSRRTMSLKEAEKCLLPLFIQSPTIVLNTLIEQVLLCGSEELDVVQVLRLVPVACLHHNSLVTELEYYFSKEKLKTCEEKNLSTLIESLMDIQTEEPLLNLNEFLQKCIIENNLKQINRLHINYECLIVALKVLTNKNALMISTEVYYSLIDKICSFISTSIEYSHGKSKAIAIATLPILEKYQEHGSRQGTDNAALDFGSNPFSTILHVYTSQLFEKKLYEDIPGVSDELCDSLWTWCCHFKDTSPFQKVILKKSIPYDSLLEVIIKVLPHFTKEEWLESTHLIEEYYKYVDPSVVPCEMQCLLPQANRRLYTVIRCLMDSYIRIIEEDLHYVAACFTNTVINLLKDKASPELYLNIFLDTCHLIAVTDTLTLHLSFLSNIKKEILGKLKDKHSKQFYNKMMYCGVKNLPDYEEKHSILRQFQ